MSPLARSGRALLLAAALGVSLAACKADPAAEAEKPISPLETLTIRTAKGEARFQVEIADDPAERQKGLMDRKALAPDRGMLFDFESETEQSFWMKNTLIPLDIIYIAEDGTIVSIAAMTTPMSEQSIPSNGPASGVLEIPGGRAGELGIAPGDKVSHRIFTGG